MIVPTAQLLSTIDDPSRGSQQIVYSPLGLHLTISGSSSPVWKSKFYGAFVLNHRVVLHAIDATPARCRGDAGS